jgi:hypothetical protein
VVLAAIPAHAAPTVEPNVSWMQSPESESLDEEDAKCTKAMTMQKFNDRLLNVQIRKQKYPLMTGATIA